MSPARASRAGWPQRGCSISAAMSGTTCMSSWASSPRAIKRGEAKAMSSKAAAGPSKAASTHSSVTSGQTGSTSIRCPQSSRNTAIAGPSRTASPSAQAIRIVPRSSRCKCNALPLRAGKSLVLDNAPAWWMPMRGAAPSRSAESGRSGWYSYVRSANSLELIIALDAS